MKTVSETNALRGRVALVGAGPGDPELLTLKAVRLLAEADVVLHDDLVPPPVLAYAERALMVNVGKRCGRKGITQVEIEARMIEYARRGMAVVRLKCGDPLVFGRAGEEMDALRTAGVVFDVVPGITAAFAAAAAIRRPLTDRRTASSVSLSTGYHAGDPTGASAVGPGSLTGATRVVYMPGRDLRPLATQLRSESLPPELPCVVVSRASQPDEAIERTTLAELGSLTPGAAPAIVLVGACFGESSVDELERFAAAAVNEQAAETLSLEG
ncbi:MAG TPA: uroporphyrinogen-III C-methyltransferase [Acidobacteriaceae bacterium]|jgi:uroporphyrin-III C-methyltransferase|nr:uroporphyrinogen-III C-methyltransferase [Acidobacteriaceae bacterium]